MLVICPADAMLTSNSHPDAKSCSATNTENEPPTTCLMMPQRTSLTQVSQRLRPQPVRQRQQRRAQQLAVDGPHLVRQQRLDLIGERIGRLRHLWAISYRQTHGHKPLSRAWAITVPHSAYSRTIPFHAVRLPLRRVRPRYFSIPMASSRRASSMA
jgi:hypothetical protein